LTRRLKREEEELQGNEKRLPEMEKRGG